MTSKLKEKNPGYNRIYKESFKRRVCEEYLHTGKSKTYLMDKYGIRGKSAILNWLRQYGYIEFPTGVRYLESDTTMTRKKKQKDLKANLHEHEQALARIKELERLLEDSELKAEAYERLVHWAERTYKIDIEKKDDSK